MVAVLYRTRRERRLISYFDKSNPEGARRTESEVTAWVKTQPHLTLIPDPEPGTIEIEPRWVKAVLGKGICLWCGEEFSKTRFWKKYCTRNCAWSAWAERHPRMAINAIKPQENI